MKDFRFLVFTCIFALVSCNGLSDKIGKIADKVQNKTYQEACNEGDFEKAHSILSDLYEEYVDAWNHDYYDDAARDDAVIASATAYVTAMQYIFTSEARTIIAENPSEVDRLVYLYTEMQQIGTKHSQIGLCDYTVKCQLLCYREYISAANNFSNSLLDLAINAGNKRLAAIVVSHFLENYEGTSDSDLLSGTSKVYYSSTDMYAAQEKFDQAVANGLFD